jgi:hypothetical protein
MQELHKIQIKYYRANVYGQTVEYIHPDNRAEADIIKQLTKRTAISPAIRELLRDLTQGQIAFVETIKP